MAEQSCYGRHFSQPRQERAFLSGVGFTSAFPVARGSPTRSRVDLQDDYWDKQGRKSIDAVAIFGGLLTMGVAGRGALAELGLLPEFLATGVRRDERERAAARDRRRRAAGRRLGRF